MTPPKFSVGERVQYVPDAMQERDRGGMFEVLRCMPIEQAGGQTYLILSEKDGHQRVAREYQLDKLILADANGGILRN
jgi:hypothetical protein